MTDVVTAVNKVVYAAEDQTGPVVQSVVSGMRSVQSETQRVQNTFESLKGVLGSAAAALGVFKFTEMIQGAIDAQAHLQDLAVKIGGTASAISSLVPAARLSNTSLDDVAAATAKLSKNLIDAANNGTSKASQAFYALGFSARDAARFLDNPAQGLFELSKRLEEFQSDGRKTGDVMELIGKNAQNLLPFMVQLAEQGKLQATVTDEQAKAAKRLQDQWTELHLRGDELKNVVAGALVPELSRLLSMWTEQTTQAGNFRDTVKDLAGDGSLALWLVEAARGAAIFGESLIAIGKIVYAFAGSVQSVIADAQSFVAFAKVIATGGLDQEAIDQFKTAVDKRNQALDEANKRWADLWNYNATAVSDALGREAQAIEIHRNVLRGLTAEQIAFNKSVEGWALGDAGTGPRRPSVDTSGVGSTKLDEFTRAVQQFREAAAAANAEWSQLLDGNKITQAEQAFERLKASDVWKTFSASQKEVITNQAQIAIALQTEVDLQKAWWKVIGEVQFTALGFTKEFASQFADLTALFNAGRIDLEQYRKLTEQLLNQQPFAKKDAEELKKLIDLEQKAIEMMGKLQDAATDALGRFADQNDRLEKENQLIGVDEVTRARILVVMDAQAERQKLILAGDTEGLALLDQQIARRQDLVQQQIELNRQQEAMRQGIIGLVDATASWLEHLGEKGHHFWDDFVSWAKSAFAKIAAQTIVLNVAASVGLGGVAGNAIASSGSGLGFLNAIGTGSNLGNLLGLGSGGGLLGGSLAYGAAVPGVSIGSAQAAALASQTGVFGAEGLSATIGAAGGSTALAGFAAAIPYIGWAVAAGTLLYSLFGGSSHGPKTQGTFSGLFTNGALTNPIGDLTGITGDNQQASKAQTFATTIAQGISSTLLALGVKNNAFQVGFGYSTDPNGTAPSFVHTSLRNGQGSTIFQQFNDNVGRDDASLQAEIALQTKRALLAALQSSDLPDYLSTLFKSVDAASGTAAQIDALIQTGEALKQLVDVMPQFASVLGSLDPTQITALTEAFGGVQAFAQSAQYLFANFTTQSDKLNVATQQLRDGFARLGIAVPQTHQAFTQLINDAIAAGDPQLAASISALAPAFIAVAGTADQAAQAVQAQAQANQALAASLHETALSFLSDAGRVTEDWRVIQNFWTQHGADLFRLTGFDHIPTSGNDAVQFWQNLAQAVDAGVPGAAELASQLRDGVLPSINDLNSHLGQLADKAQEASNAISAGSLIGGGISLSDKLLQAVDSAIGVGNLSLGDKLAQRVTGIAKQIAQLDDQIANAPWYVDTRPLEIADNKLHQAYDTASATYARYVGLVAQYGPDIGAQLEQLSESFDTTKVALAGNAAALEAAQGNFNTAWQAIINGTKQGVTGTIDQLAKLKQGLLDYVQKLQTSSLSTLTPAQQFAFAGGAFHTDVASARAGNVDALGRLTQDADAYLNAARAMFSIGQGYTDVFNEVTRTLTDVGTPKTAAPEAPIVVAVQANTAAVEKQTAVIEKIASNTQQTAEVTDDVVAALIDGFATMSDAQKNSFRELVSSWQQGAGRR